MKVKFHGSIFLKRIFISKGPIYKKEYRNENVEFEIAMERIRVNQIDDNQVCEGISNYYDFKVDIQRIRLEKDKLIGFITGSEIKGFKVGEVYNFVWNPRYLAWEIDLFEICKKLG